MRVSRPIVVVMLACLAIVGAVAQSRVALTVIASEGPAQVILAGRLVGVANPRLTTQVAPGAYDLVVRKPGLPEFRQRITVGSGGLTVQANLGGAAQAPQTIAPAPQAIAPAPQTIAPAPQVITPIPQPVTPAPQPAAPVPQPAAVIRSALGRFQAEDTISIQGTPRSETIQAPEGGTSLAFITDGSYASYGPVDFGAGTNTFRARVASATSGGMISVRIGNPTGPELGKLSVPTTGNWHSYTTVELPLSGARGVQDLVLVFQGGPGYLFNINWFEFDTAPPRAPAASAAPASPAPVPASPAPAAAAPAMTPSAAPSGAGAYRMKDGFYLGTYLFGFDATRHTGSQTVIDFKEDGTFRFLSKASFLSHLGDNGTWKMGQDVGGFMIDQRGFGIELSFDGSFYGEVLPLLKQDSFMYNIHIVGDGTLALVKTISREDVIGEWWTEGKGTGFRFNEDGTFESNMYGNWIGEGRWDVVGRSVARQSETSRGSGTYRNTSALLHFTAPDEVYRADIRTGFVGTSRYFKE